MPQDGSPFFDLAVRRQVTLERIKAGQIKDFAKVIKQIEGLTKFAFIELEEDLAGESRVFVERFISSLRQDVGQAFGAGVDSHLEDMKAVAGVTQAQTATELSTNLAGVAKVAHDPAAKAFKKVLARPLQVNGGLLKPFLTNLKDVEVDRLGNAVRLGYTQGRTNQEIIRSIIGTKAQNYQNGILATTRRNAAAVVRTSTQHVANAARMDTWEANGDIVEKYEYVATLDRVTTPQCKSLDGQEFELGKGPLPPIHIQCRSTTVPVVNPKYDFLKKGRTRSGESGPTNAKNKYFDWLKSQPKDAQVEALGATRAKLFREGGLTPEKFRALQLDKNFRPLTLAEMRAREPKAFKRAGL